jgi:hypothetical protein
VLRGVLGAWSLTFGCLFGLGHALLGRAGAAWLSAGVALLGAALVRSALSRRERSQP